MTLNFVTYPTSLRNDELSSYKNLLRNINQLEPEIKNLDLSQFKEKIRKIQLEIEASQKPSLSAKNICEIFAITREVSRRIIGLRPFDTQILGGLVLNDGFITEMKTGEGKTLVATLPAVTQSLFNKGVHIVTVNEYLAKRDCEWMGQIFKSLGLTTGLIQSQMEPKQKRDNYSKQITYVTNSELGFDYLRDNLANNLDELVLRKLNYCIIDEVDSILIDEARTPLIISGEAKVTSEKYFFAAEVVKLAEENEDYVANEKTKNVFLTEKGIKKFEKILGVDDLFKISHGWLVYILNALKAKSFYIRNIDYIVQNDEIMIVDEFTGRILSGRRWSEGLHQSIEAKENVTVKKNSIAVASITYQNFFLLYEQFAGMTGTAKSSEVEFSKIYNTKVYEIPTAKPVIREDLPDLIFSNDITKWKAVTDLCAEKYEQGQPVLVGTTSIENSELLSQLLKNYNIQHNVLNAKPENVKKESEIIAEAGCFKSITIATNMAGRGTDILLGGNPKLFTDYTLIQHVSIILKEFELLFEWLTSEIRLFVPFEAVFFNLLNNYFSQNHTQHYFIQAYEFLLNNFRTYCYEEAGKVRNLGGLCVIGTERHDSRRIDNQLKGRSGRQGDPGSSRFFLSLNDKLLRLFGSERINLLFQSIDPFDDTPLSFDFLTAAIDKAQQRVEGYNYEIRKDLFQYDQILDIHRKLIYKERQTVLRNQLSRAILLDYFDFVVLNTYSKLFNNGVKFEENVIYQLPKFLTALGEIFWVNLNMVRQTIREFDSKRLISFALDQAWLSYDLKQFEIELYDEGLVNKIERYCILQAIDETWKRHLQVMTNLRDSSVFAAFAQTEPISEYRKMSSQRFITTLDELRSRAVLNYMYSEMLYKRYRIKKIKKLKSRK